MLFLLCAVSKKQNKKTPFQLTLLDRRCEQNQVRAFRYDNFNFYMW